MAKLTQVAIGSRKAIRYIIFFIVFLTIGRIALIFSIGIYKKLFPAPPPAPTIKYGKLTIIPFPQNAQTAKLNFTLETPDGNFPQTPTQANVYFMPKSNSNLLALDSAREKVKNMGYLSQEKAINDSLYEFDSDRYPAKMIMNIITENFSISYDLSSDRTPIDSRPPVAEVAIANFRSILSSAGLLPQDLTGPSTHEFFRLVNGQLVSSISLSEADFTKVNLYRKDYNKLPAVTEKAGQGNVWAIISGAGDKQKQIIAAEFHYYKVDEKEFSTYPIKTPETAFSELKDGKAYIANIGTNKEGDNLKIRRIYLAYFDPNAETNFYQPVFVFEGDNNFVAYVPAVSAEYYGDK